METVEYTPVGSGVSVFEDDAVVEGPVVFLDTPKAVIDFVAGGAVQDTIVLARGGTTTFLTPALTSGVKGVVTLQGHPESHLGILSREYGIPCVMGVSFSSGVRSDRGETIPADGVRVRLDIATKDGRVLVEPGAPVDDTPPPEPTDADAEAAASSGSWSTRSTPTGSRSRSWTSCADPRPRTTGGGTPPAGAGPPRRRAQRPMRRSPTSASAPKAAIIPTSAASPGHVCARLVSMPETVACRPSSSTCETGLIRATSSSQPSSSGCGV